MKLAAVYVAAAMFVAGYGQGNSGSVGINSSQAASGNTSSSKPVAAAQSQSSLPQKSSADSVDGYKSFKFGMKPSELSKLAECAPNDYDYENQLKNLEDQLKNLEDQLRKDAIDQEQTEQTNTKINTMIAEEEKNRFKIGTELSGLPLVVEVGKIEERISQLKTELKSIDTHEAEDIKSRIKHLKKEEDELKANKEGHYLHQLHCKVVFAGQEKSVVLRFNDQKQLKGLNIVVALFNQQKLELLVKELRGKYPLSSSPDDVALASYNNNQLMNVSWFFANNSVELQTIKEYGRSYIELRYHDAASAKEAFNASQKGKVSSGDL